jgi:hypothetical protein
MQQTLTLTLTPSKTARSPTVAETLSCRVLKAPFKAIGRLFGGGKKKDDNKFHRLTEKDVKQFKTLPNPRLINVQNADKPTAETAATTSDAKSPSRGRPFAAEQRSTERSDCRTLEVRRRWTENRGGPQPARRGLPVQRHARLGQARI